MQARGEEKPTLVGLVFCDKDEEVLTFLFCSERKQDFSRVANIFSVRYPQLIIINTYCVRATLCSFPYRMNRRNCCLKGAVNCARGYGCSSLEVQ